MKKFWKFLLKNRIYILIFLVLVILVLIGLMVKAYLFPEDVNTNYGNRLVGIEKVPIDKAKQDEIINKLKENEAITEAKVRLQGKIINISVTATTEKFTIENLEEACKGVLELFSEDELKFYDIQFFAKNEDANYEMIGYKKNSLEEISWETDEIISSEVNEENENENKEE